MPTITQKAAILVRAGVVVPGQPAVGVSDEAVAAWNQQVDELFAAYVMSRAAQSLREAEEAQQRSQMRHVNAQFGQDDPKPRRPAAGPEGQPEASVPLCLPELGPLLCAATAGASRLAVEATFPQAGAMASGERRIQQVNPRALALDPGTRRVLAPVPGCQRSAGIRPVFVAVAALVPDRIQPDEDGRRIGAPRTRRHRRRAGPCTPMPAAWRAKDRRHPGQKERKRRHGRSGTSRHSAKERPQQSRVECPRAPRTCQRRRITVAPNDAGWTEAITASPGRGCTRTPLRHGALR